MLYLLNKDVRTVRWNGEPLHEATSAIVKETMNGDFTLTVKYPISDSGIYQLIQEDMLIKAPTPVLGAQLFRIKKPVENNDHLEITAYHISDDVMQRSITPVSVTSQSCGMALSRMVQNTKTALGDFSFNSDIQDRRTFNTTETETLYSVLLDGKHSIVGTWEGELVRDNFALTVKKSRGENRGVVITTHKNLKDYQRTKNSQNVVTRIHAKSTFKPEGAEKETTIRVTVDSPLINSYPYINEKEYENNNAKTVEELKKWAQAKFSNEGIDKVSDAIKIEAYELDGQVVHIGDTVNLKSRKHNVDSFKKAIAYEFDALKEEYISLTFDDKAGTGGSRASGGLSSAADAILGVTGTAQEIALEKALQNADLDFDHKAGLLRQEISNGIELARARAEEVKREISDTINQRFDSFDNASIQEARRKAEEALRNAGASSLLAQEAKRIGLDSIAKLEEFKRQATSAQTALLGDLDALKRTVASEVNQASEYRRTTTEALSRMTGQMDGFATKSEVKQGIDGLTQTFAKMKVGGRNYAEDYDFSRGLWRYSQGDGSPVDWKIINGEYNVKGTTRTWKQMQIHSKEGSQASGKNSTALLDLEIGETYTLSFQAICYSGNPSVWFSLRANRTVPGNPEIIYGNFNLTSSWQTYQVTIPALTKPDNFDFWRIILGYNEIGHVAFRKVELTRSSTRIDAGPAPEDWKTDLVVAKSEFQKTAEGLSAKMSAIESYVGQDGQRQEALQRYAREESAKQATAVRELVTRDFVGKSAYQEDVRGLERRFEAITNPQNGSIATQIAKYKTAVDGRFADITSLISGKANQADFQRVRETSQLYERILGNTENGIADKVARMAMTSQLFQVEVSKASKGGRNYIRNGQFKNGSKNWLEYQSVNFGLNFNYQHSQNPNNRNRPGLHFYHESQDVANFFGIQQSFAFDGVRGEKVSVSLLVSKDGGDSNSGLKVALHYIKNKNIIGQEWQSIPSPQITSKYKRFTFTFTLSDDVENLNLMLYGEKGKTINLYVTDVQLERGSVATDYKEAPEDTDEAIRSVQTQLAGSWAVQNINSTGDLISGINLGANGHNRLDGKLTHITGETLIDRAVIKSAMIDKLKTVNFEAGSVTTVVLDAEAVTAEKLKVDQAFFNKLVANEAYLSQLFAKQAFITRVQSVAIDASQVRSGILSGDRIYGGTIRGASIYGGTLTGHTQIQLGSYGSFDAVNGGLQINVPRDYNAKDGLGVQFIGSYGRGENVPYGLFLYRDSDFTIGNTATDTDEFLMTVQGYINAKGIGWLKTGKGSVNGKTTGTIGLWNSDNVSLSFGGSENDIYYSYNSTAYSLWSVVNQHFSDRRLKENIVECKHKALDYIQQFQFKEYDWKKQEDRPQQAHTKIGLIAQEVQTVDPTLVYENGDTLNLDNLRLTNIALKAIQELALENQKLTHRLENLENERRTA
ncbi:phage tail spike protein [Streptococcus oralis]|uniref:Tail fiber domain-containing protein n=1 Tax=Streptococcus oralis TaxID=1303 RepID=A0A7T3DYM4_STROR|nr:phage tail spike protein [Streptococcus oralis]QBX17237.1 hyaluronidase [Streptococcus phage Javan347]QPT02262.1 tail fiber domain-containing protein [Streptococcus oralis]CAK1607855.1 Tail fiber domain-containing protein [Streptococcus oralis subsp. dentisani]